MAFRLLADLVVVVHAAFILFVVLGGLVVLRWPRVAWLHLPAAVWGAWIELAGWLCPLTPLENWLREQGGAGTYGSGFVERYLLPLIYPGSLTRELQWLLGGSVVLINAALYLVILRRSRGREELPCK